MLVRNRAWALPYVLPRLPVELQGQAVRYHFLVNDSSDESADLLHSFAKQHSGKVTISNWKLGTPPDARDGRVRQNGVLQSLAILRNALVEQAYVSVDCDALFSVDSDVLLPPGALQQLVEASNWTGHEATVGAVAGLLWNDATFNWRMQWPHRYPNVLHDQCIPVRKQIEHYKDHTWLSPFPVDITGAVVLILRRAFAARYDYHAWGEDVIWSRHVRALGLQLLCNPRVRCGHLMDPTLINHPERIWPRPPGEEVPAHALSLG